MLVVTLARKPLVGSVAENVIEHGTGGLNIDGCRIVTETAVGPRFDSRQGKRFPANVILQGDEVTQALGEQSGEVGAHSHGAGGVAKRSYVKFPHIYGEADAGLPFDHCDTGTAARFFKQVDP